MEVIKSILYSHYLFIVDVGIGCTGSSATRYSPASNGGRGGNGGHGKYSNNQVLK